MRGDPAAIPKLQGYNEGFNKAVNTFQEVIGLLLVSMIVQAITHRLLYREKPFSITINDPITGEILLSKGSNYKPKGRNRRIIKLINQASFSASFLIAAYLFANIIFPAYSYEVITQTR